MTHVVDDRRARILSALAEPVRMAMVDHLLLGDASPSELGAQVGLGSNLLAHHLRVLEEAGVVRPGPLRRRPAPQLRATAYRPSPRPRSRRPARPASTPAPRVIFVCTANSARSQLAAATWNQLSPIPATSAGTHPGPRIHPRAIAAAHRHGLRLGADRPVPVADQLHDGDLVVAVCDNAHEELATDLPRLHWSVPDPVRVDTDAAFEAAYTDINRRVRHLTAVYDANQKAS